MDKETLRKQLYEEIHSQFEAKLREAKREKTQLEEEIESASEKWRAERRRLNGEIDRLESKVAEARDTRRKSPDAKVSKGPDPEEIAQLQAAADEQVRAATEAFEAERQQLQAENSRLQRGIAEIIERSNNPLRSNQAEKERFETRLEDALKARRHAENALLVAKAEWEQEKLKLIGDNVKLRRPSQEKPSQEKPSQEKPAAKPDDSFVGQLEKKLDETLKSRDKLAEDFEKAKHQAKLKQEEFDALTLQLERSHKERANLERQLRETSKTPAAPSLQHGDPAEIATLKDQLDKSQKERTNLERQVREASKTQERLERELDKMKQSPIVMKEGQSAEIERLREEVRNARAEVKAAAGQVDEVKSTASKERSALEKQLREVSSQHEKVSRELDRVRHASTGSKDNESAAVARLKQDYQQAQAEARLAVAASKQQYAAELARLQQELNDAKATVQRLESSGASETPEAVNSEIVEQLRHQYDERMQEMIHQKTALSEELRNVTSLLEEERVKLASSNGTSNSASSDSPDRQLIDSEVERIQEMIAGIARLIDDPETELSTVIRKNVERAELDAYLKGILFSLGRNTGM